MTLRGHEGIVLAVAFDRSKIMSASDDGTLRTWVWAARGPKQASKTNHNLRIRQLNPALMILEPHECVCVYSDSSSVPVNRVHTIKCGILSRASSNVSHWSEHESSDDDGIMFSAVGVCHWTSRKATAW